MPRTVDGTRPRSVDRSRLFPRRGPLPRRRIACTLLAALATGAALLGTSGEASAGAASRPAADTITTVDFEAYPPGTEITNQYPGITFEYPTAADFTAGTPGPGATGVVSSDVGGPPIVTTSGAHSGSQAGELTLPGEFGGVGTFLALSNLADSVSVYVGDLTLPSVHVELDAYDSNRQFLGSDTAVTSQRGAQTLLTYSTGGAGTIAYVAVYRSDIEDTDGVIDDLSVDVPPPSSPIVGVAATTTTYELAEGASRQVTLTVNRLDGAGQPVTIAVSGLPSGVTASLSENPVTLPDTTTTLTMTAAANAAVANASVSLAATSTGAVSEAPAVITLDVVLPLAIAVPNSLDVGACASDHTTVTAQLGPGLSGEVSFSAANQMSTPGLSVAVSPTEVTPVNGTAQTTLTVSSSGGQSSGAVAITAALSDGASDTVDIPAAELGPEVTSIDALDSSDGLPVAGLDADTPRAERPGTTVEITGQYFCSSATVAFGNSAATVSANVQHESGAQGPYDYLRVTTPRDATSGPLTVTSGSPSASGASSQSLTIDSYRNSEAFAFHNFNPVLSFEDLTDAFGSKETYVNVNVCGFLTLGLANCNAALVPDPVAVVALEVAEATMATGTCFGISLTDQRLLSGAIDLDSLPRDGDLVYDLAAPKVDSGGTARGSEPLLVELKAQHLMQLSTEFLTLFGARAANQATTSSSNAVADITTEIGKAFAAGRYPMIELADGSEGHVVIAYDLVATSSGGYDIYVYDSNNPFTPKEDSDTSGATHAAAVAASVIHLDSDGNWTLASTTDSDGAAFHGSQGQLVVTDPASIPQHPTLATLGGVAPGLLFSSDSAPGSAGASEASSAELTQITGSGGKTLFGRNGSLDTDPATRLDAAPFAPLVDGTTGNPSRPALTVIGASAGPIEVATRGMRAGGMAETLIDGGFVGSVDASTGKGADATAAFSAASGTVGLTGSSTAPISLSVDRVNGGGSQSVEIVTAGASSGNDTLALAPSGAVTIAHSGPPTTFTLTLGGESHSALPASFTSGPISLASGQSARIGGIHWASLATGRLTVQIGQHLLELRNRLGAARLVSIHHLAVLHAAHHRLALVVAGQLAALPAGSQASVLWLVHQGRRVVAEHVAPLSVTHRSFSATWVAHLAKARALTFSAVVLVVAGEGSNARGSATASSLRLSVG